MLTLSVSDLKLYLQCPQKFHYGFTHLRGTDTRSEALDLGTLMHKAIAAKAEGGDPTAVRAVADAWFLDATSRQPAGEQHFQDVFNKYLVYEAALLEWKPFTGEEVLAVEVEHRLPLIPGVELVGTLDTVVRWNGKLWHRQRKTIDPTKPRATFAECQRTDWHETAYHWMIDEFYGESSGTILDLFLKQTKKAMAEGAPLVETWPLPREKGIETQTHKDICDTAARILMETPEAKNVLRNRAACGGMFGNSLCPYKEVCDGSVPLNDHRFTDLEPRYRRDVGSGVVGLAEVGVSG